MKTLFLGAYGFGNLGDELCLIEAAGAFPCDEVWIRTVSDDFTSRFIRCAGFIPWEPACPGKGHEVAFSRVVLGGGGILSETSGKDYMSWLAAAQRSGARTYVHNVGVTSPDQSWLTPQIRAAFDKLDGMSVRDRLSLEWLRQWGITRDIGVTGFTEKNLAADTALADSLGTEDLLGISVMNTDHFFRAVEGGREAIRRTIAKIAGQFKGLKILPIVSTVHLFSEQENDIEGFKRFYEMFLGDFDLALPETLDRRWWRGNMTPQRLKGLISRCRALLSRRKHNCLHAIACGVKTIGMSTADDHGVSTVFESLKDILPAGSEMLILPEPARPG